MIAKEKRPPCFYKSFSTGSWKERITLDDLKVGDELVDCRIVEELFDAKTGPKVFCDCGVGRFVSGRSSEDASGNVQPGRWKIVNAMLRLDRKQSVARKRVARLKKRKVFTAYVARIRRDNQRFEVALSPDEALMTTDREKFSASTLVTGQEVIGRVVRIEPFGVFVDVGANRVGLLHVQKVADLYGHYIDKAKGLTDAGLERGAKVRLQVVSNERQRLFLDFTQDVKDEASTDLETQPSSSDRLVEATSSPPSRKAASVDTHSRTSPIAFENNSSAEEADEVDRDEYDEYDEDRDIEDALGLGTY